MAEPDTPSGDDGEIPADAAGRLAEEKAIRLAKLDALRKAGTEPYPYRFDRSATLAEVRATHGELPAGTETEDRVTVAGRLMLIRRMGKLTFATMRDASGEIQLFASRGVLGEEAHAAFDDLDRGDWVGATGTVMTTRKGELSVKVDRFELLAKALRPLPDKWKGLTDTDTRYRQRYADLIVNDEARRVFEIRHAAVASLRRTLTDRQFVEVEGPVLHGEAGGAHARPFVTHHNALDLDLYLRIAEELHLKRLVVGGMERVFEIGRVFRNEGLSTRHNPEFTMLEAYQAFADYTDMMELFQALVVNAACDATGSTVITVDGAEIDLAQPWRRAPILALIEEFTGLIVHPSMPVEELRKILDERGVKYAPHMGSGKLCVELYDHFVEPKLRVPTFVMDHPREVSPLARQNRTDPDLVERFEPVIAGRELGNAFSELNDPIDQRERFEDEQRAKEAGDAEAGTVDEDYVRALEYGLPPTGGLGLGVDRLVMLLSGVTTIRDVILFPTLRPEAER